MQLPEAFQGQAFAAPTAARPGQTFAAPTAAKTRSRKPRPSLEGRGDVHAANGALVLRELEAVRLRAEVLVITTLGLQVRRAYVQE